MVLSEIERPKLKRPDPIKVPHTYQHEFEMFKTLSKRTNRPQLTPTTATTPSVAIYGSDHFRQLVSTPSSLSQYFNSPRTPGFKVPPSAVKGQFRVKTPLSDTVPEQAEKFEISDDPVEKKDEGTRNKKAEENGSATEALYSQHDNRELEIRINPANIRLHDYDGGDQIVYGSVTIVFDKVQKEGVLISTPKISNSHHSRETMLGNSSLHSAALGSNAPQTLPPHVLTKSSSEDDERSDFVLPPFSSLQKIENPYHYSFGNGDHPANKKKFSDEDGDSYIGVDRYTDNEDTEMSGIEPITHGQTGIKQESPISEKHNLEEPDESINDYIAKQEGPVLTLPLSSSISSLSSSYESSTSTSTSWISSSSDEIRVVQTTIEKKPKEPKMPEIVHGDTEHKHSPIDPSKAEPGTIVYRLAQCPKIWEKVARSKKGVYRCNHCSMRFNKLLYFAQHMDQAGLKRSYPCDVPDCPWHIIGFTKRTEWSRHTKHQHSTDLYVCKFQDCDKSFSRKDSMKRHYLLVHENADSRRNRKMQTLAEKELQRVARQKERES